MAWLCLHAIEAMTLLTRHCFPPGVTDSIEQYIGTGNKPGESSVLTDLLKEVITKGGEYVSSTFTGRLTDGTMILGWGPV